MKSAVALFSVQDVGGGWWHACADLVWSEFTFSWPRQPLLVIKLSIRPGMYASPEHWPPDTGAFGNLAGGRAPTVFGEITSSISLLIRVNRLFCARIRGTFYRRHILLEFSCDVKLFNIEHERYSLECPESPDLCTVADDQSQLLIYIRETLTRHVILRT